MKILIVGHDVPENIIKEKSEEVRKKLQEGYSYYIEPIVLKYKKSNCWKIASLCVSNFLGSTKHFNECISNEGVKEIIENADCEIIIIVVNFETPEEVAILLGYIGCIGSKNWEIIKSIDLTKNLVYFNRTVNRIEIF